MISFLELILNPTSALAPSGPGASLRAKVEGSNQSAIQLSFSLLKAELTWRSIAIKNHGIVGVTLPVSELLWRFNREFGFDQRSLHSGSERRSDLKLSVEISDVVKVN